MKTWMCIVACITLFSMPLCAQDDDETARLHIVKMEKEIQDLRTRLSASVREANQLRKENARLRRQVRVLESKVKAFAGDAESDPATEEATDPGADKPQRRYTISDYIADRKMRVQLKGGNPVRVKRWQKEIAEKYHGQQFVFANILVRDIKVAQRKGRDVVRLSCSMYLNSVSFVDVRIEQFLSDANAKRLELLQSDQKINGFGTVRRIDFFAVPPISGRTMRVGTLDLIDGTVR